MLEAVTRTSFHQQPEAQHPKFSDIHKLGRPITPIFVRDSDQTADIAKENIPAA
jgi:hypothetical protein